MISREKLKAFLDKCVQEGNTMPNVVKGSSWGPRMVIWEDFERNYTAYSNLEKWDELLPEVLEQIKL